MNPASRAPPANAHLGQACLGRSQREVPHHRLVLVDIHLDGVGGIPCGSNDEPMHARRQSGQTKPAQAIGEGGAA
jgi:hypothetical protein